MNTAQRKKYQSLLSRAEFTSLVEALCLMRRACFHESLVPDYTINLPEPGSSLTGKSACSNYSQAYMGLLRQPALHISRRLDLSTLNGSCKLEHLVSRLKDPTLGSKRVVVVVGSDLESIITHRCLQSHSVSHLFQKFSTNPALSILSMQETIVSFNDPSRDNYSSSIVVVQDVVFSYPYIAPAQVDVIFILSGSWATTLNVKRSLRVHGTLFRLVAADTLEELMERKGGSFLHLQGYKIPDARPVPISRAHSTFTFDSNKLLASAPAMLEYLKEMATPPMQFGLGKGKGCFLSGFQAINVSAEKDDVDTQAPIIQWISRFYYDLETAERRLNSRFEGESSINIPSMSLRQLSSDTSSHALSRYASILCYKILRSFSHLSDSIKDESSKGTSKRSLSEALASIHHERISYLTYNKAFHQSSIAEDFAQNLHLMYRSGLLVDANLYVSPLCLTSAKNELFMPPSKSRFSQDFSLQYIHQPLPPVIKPQPKKSRSGSNANPNAAPSKRKNSNPSEKAPKKAATVVPEVPNVVSQASVLAFDDFGEFAIRSYFPLIILQTSVSKMA